MKRILITGGAGFIGSNLVKHLSALGDFHITILDNETVGKLADIAEPNIKCIHGDIRDTAALEGALVDIETVVHLAADTGVIQSTVDPETNFQINAFGTFQLLNSARKTGVKRILNASTGGAILGDVIPPAHEGIVPQPMSAYGASKLAAEGYCSAFAGSYGLATASLRFSNIYGPGSFHKGSVVATFFKGILQNRDLVVFGDGEQTRDFLFVGDLVEGIRLAIESEFVGVVQLGSGTPTSLNQLLSEVHTVVGDERTFAVEYQAYRKGEIRDTWCDISKARRELSFNPQTELGAGLAKTWDWFVSSGENH